MEKRKTIGFTVCFLSVLFLMIPGICAAADYEVLNSGFAISDGPRHDAQQWVSYNPINNDYMVSVKRNGRKTGNCVDPDAYECTNCFQSLHTIQVSYDGNVLNDNTLLPPEGPLEDISFRDMPRTAHNPYRNEYMMIYLQAPYVCVKCHTGSASNTDAFKKGTVAPGKCANCHPFATDPGKCNLAAAHAVVKDADWAKVQDADCQSCHTDCAGGPPPATQPSPDHMTYCMVCHIDVKHNWLHGNPTGNEVYAVRIDGDGKRIGEPRKLMPSRATAAHTAIAFDPDKRQYLAVWGDRGIYSKWTDNIAFILDEDGNTLKGPFMAQTGEGNHFPYDIQYNPANKTYMTNWEDFRHSGPPYWYWPDDIYGAILDNEGTIVKDYAVIEDCGTPEMSDQWWPSWALNTDKNEWLVTWVDKNSKWEAKTALLGRIINADGTLKGEPFLIIDGHKTEAQQALVYVPKEKKYFMVWQDSSEFAIDPAQFWLAENDIYGSWLDDNGKPAGDFITIYKGPGDQTIPRVNYNPLMDQFLITWWDTYALQDYQPLDCENIMWAGPVEEGGDIAMPMMGLWLGDMNGTLYGKPSFLAVRVVTQATGKPVEGANVTVVGLGLFQTQKTNIGGWCNLPKEAQSNGKYYVVAWGKGAMAMEQVQYKGEPLQATIELK